MLRITTKKNINIENIIQRYFEIIFNRFWQKLPINALKAIRMEMGRKLTNRRPQKFSISQHRKKEIVAKIGIDTRIATNNFSISLIENMSSMFICASKVDK
jgi:hypothetical protein